MQSDTILLLILIKREIDLKNNLFYQIEQSFSKSISNAVSTILTYLTELWTKYLKFMLLNC